MMADDEDNTYWFERAILGDDELRPDLLREAEADDGKDDDKAVDRNRVVDFTPHARRRCSWRDR